MWVAFLHSFPGNEAHELFPGGPEGGEVLGGGTKLMLKKKCVQFFS